MRIGSSNQNGLQGSSAAAMRFACGRSQHGVKLDHHIHGVTHGVTDLLERFYCARQVGRRDVMSSRKSFRRIVEGPRSSSR